MRVNDLFCFVSAICCIAVGCNRYIDVPVRVEDAETGAPIEGAVARSEYITEGLTLVDFLPFGTRLRELRRSTARSDANGLATVQLTPDADMMFQGVSAKSDGYLDGFDVPVTKHVLRALHASRRKVAGEDAEPVARIPMLAKPAPRVVLVIPDGYRGIVRVISRRSAKPAVPGQRVFAWAVFPKEVASIELPMFATPYDYHSPWLFQAKYAGGGELPPRPRALETDVALRAVDSRGDQHLLVVGTEAEREALHDYCNPGHLPNEARWRTIWNTGTFPAQLP